MYNNQVKSCCVTIDKSFYILIISTIIVLLTLGLSIYKLIIEHECFQTTPYYMLLSNMGSVALGYMFHYLKHKNDPNPEASV